MEYRIPVYKPEITPEDVDAIRDAAASGWVSSKGPYIEKFEDQFAKYVGTRHGVATSNGTTSLHLALAALGIGPGDEVVVPSFTFVAVANAVRYLGATPVFADSDPSYWGIDPSDIEKKVGRRTKAVIAAHMYGHPCDMERIAALARSHNLTLVEDCAEAHGAEYKRKKVGGFGEVSCFSFYGNKIITTGEGGMCLTSDAELDLKMRVLRDHGMSRTKKYWHEVVGYNYRMTNLQAALGVSQLRRIDSVIGAKRRLAARYAGLLGEARGFTPAIEMSWARCVYWMYSVLVEAGRKSRDRLMESLHKRGIESRPFFYPIHTLPPYATGQRLPNAELISANGINLPSSPQLTETEVKEVVAVVLSER
jgi:perosamine synthetase